MNNNKNIIIIIIISTSYDSLHCPEPKCKELPQLTFIRNLKAQGATCVIRFKIEPHLMAGTDH